MKASDVLSTVWNIVREDDFGHAMIELEGKYHIVEVTARSYQFLSVLPGDMPSDGGRWCSNWTEGGLQYVSRGRSRKAANAQWRKYIVPYTIEAEEIRRIMGE